MILLAFVIGTVCGVVGALIGIHWLLREAGPRF